MKIAYSAPAKVILSGEHAVVYGKPGLVAAIDLRLKLAVWESKTSYYDKTLATIEDTVKKYLRKNKIPFREKEFDYKISLGIPIGQRLGSSAALSVTSAAALIHFFTGEQPTTDLVNNVSYQIEKNFHQNPSGVDTSTSCYGGLIYYRKEFEFLRNISSLNFKIPKKIDDSLYLIDSGLPKENTGEMVNNVKELYNTKPKLIDSVLNDIEKTTKRLTVSLIKEDLNLFMKSIVDNQIFLEMLGVVSDRAKQLLNNLSKYGVGKVSGGGGKKTGSGYLLFCTNQKEKLEAYLRKEKIRYYKFRQSAQGVKQEND